MGLNAKLVVVGGDLKTTEIDLKLPAIVGRGRGAAILLPHPLVSRQHCELYENDGCLMVRDLGSLNGTYIGQDKITECPLPPGGLLTVGAVTFRAVYDGEGVAAEANGKHAGDTAVGMPGVFGEETVPTDEVVVNAAPPQPVPAIIPTVAAPRPAAPVAAPAKAVVPVKAVTPAKPVAAVPVAAVPVAPPAQPPTVAPPASAAADEHADEEQAEAADAEDDFQSFLKSLDGK